MKRIHRCTRIREQYRGYPDAPLICHCGYMQCCDSCGRLWSGEGTAFVDHLPAFPYKCVYGSSVLKRRFFADFEVV